MPPKMTANPAKPVRHRAGKPTGTNVPSSSDDSDSDENDVSVSKPKPRPVAAPPPPSRRTGPGRVVTHANLAQVMGQDAPRQGSSPVFGRQQTAEEDAKRRARIALERKAAADGFVTESEDESDGEKRGTKGGANESDESDESDEEESGDDDDSDDDASSDESSSDDGQPVKIVLPKFLTKAQREKADADRLAKEAGENDATEAERERQAALDALVEEQLRKQAAQRMVVKKQWEDSADFIPVVAEGDSDDNADEDGAGVGTGNGDVTTDDDVDPEAEHAAWKLRELKRIKRSRERIEERERELAEMERRNGLTEEERAAEDAARLAAQAEAAAERGPAGFMQKYRHRGAFFADQLAAEGLDQRDLMGAHYVDEVRNRDLLPKALQMRDMTRLGRKGASKYRDLRTEDTGRWGVIEDARRRDVTIDAYGRAIRGSEAVFGNGTYDGSDSGGWRGRDGDKGAKGANAIPLGERKIPADQGHGEDDQHRDRERERDRYDRERDRDRHRDGERDRDRYRDRERDDNHDWDRHRDRDRDRYRQRSQSRTPRRERRERRCNDDDKADRRKRSPPSPPSQDYDRDSERLGNSDKRRRVEA